MASKRAPEILSNFNFKRLNIFVHFTANIHTYFILHNGLSFLLYSDVKLTLNATEICT